MMKVSPNDLTKKHLIEYILKLIPAEDDLEEQHARHSFRQSRNPKELKLSDQMDISLKIAQHLKEVAK